MKQVAWLLSGLQEYPLSRLGAFVEHRAGLIREAGLRREANIALENRNDTASRWLRAVLSEDEGAPAQTQLLFARVTTPAGCQIADVLLRRARLAARCGDGADATQLLREALQLHPDYPFYLRAESLVKKCMPLRPTRRRTRVALLGSCTTSLLRPVLDILFLRDGIEAEFYEGPFASYRQEIADKDSGLCTFGPDFVILLLNWRDLGLSDLTSSPSAVAKQIVAELRDVHDQLLSRCACQIIQPSFTPPSGEPCNALSSLLPGGRTHVIREINRMLWESVSAQVTILDAERLAAQCPGQWESPIQWSSARVYPAPDAYPMLAEQLSSFIRALLGLSSKVLAVDLDNTLWGGIIGEEGLGGIQLGGPSAAGERYQEVQRYLKGLRERGVLLAVVSKNNFNDAASVFQHHQGSVLKLEDFASFKANWEDKSANLTAVAMDLGLGLDSFVFLDDNPAERARVRAELPEVVTPEISTEPAGTIVALERGLYFQTLRLTDEDEIRAASYAALASSQALRQAASSLDEYLRSLQMEIDWGAVDVNTCERVTQLINKTNQFNLTTKRYSQAEVQHRMVSQDFWFRWYRLRDRFADHGLIAVVLAEAASEEWTVDLWLMSCRVIGRGVEGFMLRDLGEAARRSGAARLRARYIPTAKNKLVEDLLPRFGFLGADEPSEFVLDLASAYLPPRRFFGNAVPAEQAGVAVGSR